MKQLVIILCIVIISGCATTYKERNLVGKWEEVSITDIETGEVEIREGEPDRILVLLTMDSLYLIMENYNYPEDHIYEDGVSWEIKGDSLFVGLLSYQIKELKPDHIILRENNLETKFRKIK